MSMRSSLPSLWERRSLIWALTISGLKEKQSTGFLGCAWWLLDPILMTIVYTVVVGFIRGRGEMVPAYPAFAMCGLLVWKSFSNAVTQAIDSLGSNEGIIRSFPLPKAVFPVSQVLSNHVLFLFSLVPLFGLALFYRLAVGVEQLRFGAALAFLPVLLLAQFMLSLGAALVFSCLGVFFKDLGRIMTHVLRVMWYVSPGLYSISDVINDYPGLLRADWGDVRTLYVLNPFAHLMEGYRSSVLYNRLPDVSGAAYALAFGALFVAVGLWLFRSQERKFVKLV